MRFFLLIRAGIDPLMFLDEIAAEADAFGINTGRQDKIAAQKETETVFLKNATRRPDLPVNDNQESEFTDQSQRFPRAVTFMTAFAKSQNATLSRATIVRLKPRSRVYPHTDAGSYYLIRDRYHFVVQSEKGSILLAGDEGVRMKPGELWWFDNKQHHEAFNDSDEWRIHFIFDLLPDAHKHLAINPLPPVSHPPTLVETAPGTLL